MYDFLFIHFFQMENILLSDRGKALIFTSGLYKPLESQIKSFLLDCWTTINKTETLDTAGNV